MNSVDSLEDATLEIADFVKYMNEHFNIYSRVRFVCEKEIQYSIEGLVLLQHHKYMSMLAISKSEELDEPINTIEELLFTIEEHLSGYRKLIIGHQLNETTAHLYSIVGGYKKAIVEDVEDRDIIYIRIQKLDREE